jgi:hypothetical protein
MKEEQITSKARDAGIIHTTFFQVSDHSKKPQVTSERKGKVWL